MLVSGYCYCVGFALLCCFLLFCFASRRRHTRCALVTGVQTCALPIFSIASMPRNGQVRLSAPRLYSMNRILPLNATPHLSSKRAHGLSRSLKSLTVNPELQCPMLGQPQLMEIDSQL